MTVPGFRHLILLRESVSVAYVLLLAIDTELGYARKRETCM